jgi:hypothetical protein
METRGTDRAALHGASTAAKGRHPEGEPVMFGRLVLCVSCLLALPAVASAQGYFPENTQWYALLRP